MKRLFLVYIMTNKNNTTLYTGMTSSLANRIRQHKEKNIPGFTKRYNLTKLVYYELCDSAYGAISREKQIKAGSRKKKEELINSVNPEWNDLSEGLY
ncbi:MAG TPA: GIY-YIG nuclease family protein [Candidatus Acidoferrales bacterium]|nr:GIY-YIG nuclease family protein [Candidatus Acidoferrales bacterium]